MFIVRKPHVLSLLVGLSLTASAAADTLPRSAVFGIAPGAVGTSTCVTLQDGTGQAVPIGCMNQQTHSFLPQGQDAVKALANSVQPNRPNIAAATTTIGATPTVVYPVGYYVSIRIRMAAAGQQVACTGDGTTPVIGTSTTATAPGQDIYWPIQTGGAAPTGPVQCVATAPITIIAEAH